MSNIVQQALDQRRYIMANKYMKRQLVISQIQVQTSMRCTYLNKKQNKTKSKNNAKSESVAIRIRIHCW